MIGKEINEAWEKGLSFIPLAKTKQPIVKTWEEFQTRLASPEELNTWYHHPAREYWGLVCGKVSGNLEVIDVDCKYDNSEGKTLMKDYCALIKEELGQEFFKGLVISETVNKGYHIIFTCNGIEGNKKLASNEDKEVLLETRGEGGYIVCPPSEGYKFLQGDLLSIPHITKEERRILFELARSRNQYFPSVQIRQSVASDLSFNQEGAFEDYNRRGNILKLLESFGWNEDTKKSKGNQVYLTRPGKSKGISASYCLDRRLFYVFTSSTEFEEGKGYNHSQVYTVLKHFNGSYGDYSAASKDLYEQGYGERQGGTPKIALIKKPLDETKLKEIDLKEKKYENIIIPLSQELIDVYKIKEHITKPFTLVIPVVLAGKTVNAIFFNYESIKYSFLTNDPECGFNADNASRFEEVIVCRCPLSVLILNNCGFKNVISVRTSKELTAIYPVINNVKKWIILYEKKDTPWKKEVVRRLKSYNCRTVLMNESIIEQYHDPKDISAVVNTVNSAEEETHDTLFTFDSFFDEMLDQLVNGIDTGLATGMAAFDAHWRPALSQLDVIVGPSNLGKSFLTYWRAAWCAFKYDWRYMIFSSESKKQRIARIMLQMFFGASYIKGRNKTITSEQLHQIRSWFNEHFIFNEYHNSKRQPTHQNILEDAEVAVAKYGINAVILDPVNSLADTMNNDLLDQYYSNMMDDFVRFKNSHHLNFTVVGHPISKAARDNRPVRISEMRGGPIFESKCDTGVSVYRDKTSKETKNHLMIQIQKIRDDEIVGQTTTTDDPIMLRMDFRVYRLVTLDGEDPLIDFVQKILS